MLFPAASIRRASAVTTGSSETERIRFPRYDHGSLLQDHTVADDDASVFDDQRWLLGKASFSLEEDEAEEGESL
jgi:hypothetical protein